MKVVQRALPFREEVGQRYEFLLIAVMGLWVYLISTGHLDEQFNLRWSLFIVISLAVSTILLARRAHRRSVEKWEDSRKLHQETCKLPRITGDIKQWLEDNGCECTVYSYRMNYKVGNPIKKDVLGDFADNFVEFHSNEDELLFNITFPELGYLRRS